MNYHRNATPVNSTLRFLTPKTPVRDPAGGLHLSEGGETGQRSTEEAGASGKTEDIVGDQPSKYSEPQPREESERQ